MIVTKIQLMQAATQLTMAACGNLPPCQISPDLSDNSARAKNLHIWETWKAMYVGLVKAMSDSALPDPPEDAVGTAMSSLLGGANQPNGMIQQLIQKVVGSIPGPIGAIASIGSLPMPGQTVTPPATK